MAAQQRGVLPSLRVAVPQAGQAASSPTARLSKYHIAFSPSPTPGPVIYQAPHTGRLWVAILVHLSALYATRQWLARGPEEEKSLVRFGLLAFLGTCVILGFAQRPWKGRAISGSQWALLFVGGALLAGSFLLRMRGLADVGPLATVLAEFSGAVVGKVLVKSQRRVHGIGGAKIRGGLAFVAGLFLLSQGWAISPCSPLSSLFTPAPKGRRLTRAARIGFYSESRSYMDWQAVGAQTEENCADYVHIWAPVFAGVLYSAQRLLPSGTSLANVPKKRLQALTYMTAGVWFIPIAVFQGVFLGDGSSGHGLDQRALWPLFSMIAFGMVLAFYGEFFSEEKLLISPLSPFYFFVTVCCVCLLELTYGSNFSLLGFLVCAGILSFGVRAGAYISGGLDWNSLSEKQYGGTPLWASLKTPLRQIWTDEKTRKIAMFLLLNTSFMVVEFVYGFLSNSLGLISDACHMLFDCAALAIGLYASYISRLPPNSNFHFGYGRFEVLSGYANAVFLILVASLIVLESLERLLEPPEISTESLLVVSVGGLVVNIVGLIFFHEAHHHAHGDKPCTHAHHGHSHKAPPTPILDLGEPQMQASTQPREPFIGGGEISPFLNPQLSSLRVNGHDSHQHLHNGRGPGSENDHLTSFLSKGRDNGPQLPVISRSVPKELILHSHGGHKHETARSMHSPRHHDHRHGASWLEDHGAKPDQHNPFVQQSPTHGGQHVSEPSVDDDGQEHFLSDTRPHNLWHPQSQSGDQQFGFHAAHHHESSPVIQSRQPLRRLSTRHQHDVPSGSPGQEDHLHRDGDYQGEGKRKDSDLNSVDHGPGHAHHHRDSHDHDHHREEAQHSHHYGHGAGDGVHHHHHHDHGLHHDHCEEGQSHAHHGDKEQHGHDHGNGVCHGHGHGAGDGVHHHHHDHGLHNNCQDGHIHGHHGEEEQHGHEQHGQDHGHGICNGAHHHHHNHELHSHGHEGHDHDHEDDHSEHQDIDHNMEGIFLHILADTLGSVGVVISTLLIKYKGWLFTDPACSIFISALIVSSVLPLVRNSAEMLLQRVPRSAEKRLKKALREVNQVIGVEDWHKLHVWSNSNSELVSTLRLHASVGVDKRVVHDKVSRILRGAGIADLTLEVEDLEHEDDSEYEEYLDKRR